MLLFVAAARPAARWLVRHGGVLGTILHVLQQRHAVIEEFHRLLTKAWERWRVKSGRINTACWNCCHTWRPWCIISET
jgi:hypothetical protein